MMCKIIVISGSPGVGKSTWAKILAQHLGFERIDLHTYYPRISSSYSQRKHCYDIDLKKFTKLVRTMQKRCTAGLVVDSHIAHLLPRNLVDLCLVFTCSNLKTLIRRLEKRRYPQKKIRENLDAEIFQLCLMGAHTRGHKVLVFDSSKQLKQEDVLRDVQQALRQDTRRKKYPTKKTS